MIRRRSFLKSAGVLVTAATGGSALWANKANAQPEQSSKPSSTTFRLAMAGYSFNKFDLDQTLKMLQVVDVHFLCIKDFHLPLKSTPEEIASFHAKCRAANVTGYGVGPIYMGSEEEAHTAFDYARRVGVNLVVGVPFKTVDKKRVSSPELLEVIQRLVKEYDMKYAIHNHGPDMPELFPNAESGINLINRMDKRVGLCLDIGHEFRDGKDPVKSMQKYADRIYDIHLKNVTSPDRQGRSIELPRGNIDLAAFVRTLRNVRYTGMCGLEHEKDMENPLTGIAESVGYLRGLVDATA